MSKMDKIAAILETTKERLYFHFSMYALAVVFGLFLFSFNPTPIPNSAKYSVPAKHIIDSMNRVSPAIANNP